MFETREEFEAYLADQEQKLGSSDPAINAAADRTVAAKSAKKRGLSFPMFVLSRIVPLLVVGCIILWKCIPVESKQDRKRTQQNVSSFMSLFGIDSKK